MSQLAKRGKGNGVFPFLSNDLLASRFLTPDVFDFDDDFSNTGVTFPAANITEANVHFRGDPKKEITVS